MTGNPAARRAAAMDSAIGQAGHSWSSPPQTSSSGARIRSLRMRAVSAFAARSRLRAYIATSGKICSVWS